MSEQIVGLVKKYKKEKLSIINPDELSWDDLGFTSAPEGYADVNDYLEREGEFDEGQQANLERVCQIISELEAILEIK